MRIVSAVAFGVSLLFWLPSLLNAPCAVMLLTCAAFPSAGILYYDYALTLPLEARTYWRKRPSGAGWFYLANRLLGTLGHVPVLLELYFIWDQKVRAAALCDLRRADSRDQCVQT